MRTRTALLAALLALPAVLTGQRLPVVPRRTIPEPASLPPQAEPVDRALRVTRSRWSIEGYGLVSNIRMPEVAGGGSGFTTFGSGTRGDYRYAEHFTVTMDLTASMLNAPAFVATAEAGTRYVPMPRAEDVRPYFDLRGAFMHMYDTYPGSYANHYGETARYSRGFGGVAGAGMEFSVSNTLAVTTELSAMRSRMTLYRLTGPASFPSGADYWLTSIRYQIGIRYNRMNNLRMAQNPRQ